MLPTDAAINPDNGGGSVYNKRVNSANPVVVKRADASTPTPRLTRTQTGRNLNNTPIETVTYTPRKGANGARTHTPYFPYFAPSFSAFANFRDSQFHRRTRESKPSIINGAGARLAKDATNVPIAGSNPKGIDAAAPTRTSKVNEVNITETVGTRPLVAIPMAKAAPKRTPLHVIPNHIARGSSATRETSITCCLGSTLAFLSLSG